MLFHHQNALADHDLRRYAAELELDVGVFEGDRASARVLERVDRDVQSGIASGEVGGTPTLFIDGVVQPLPRGAGVAGAPDRGVADAEAGAKPAGFASRELSRTSGERAAAL